jgi:hypothetical protein
MLLIKNTAKKIQLNYDLSFNWAFAFEKLQYRPTPYRFLHRISNRLQICNLHFHAMAVSGYSPAIITAIMPLKKTPSNVPAPPMLATGAPTLEILGRFTKSAPINVPSTPAV